MINRFKEIKKELKKLNGLQWTKKQALNRIVQNQANAQRRMHVNKVVGPEGHPGAPYVPLYAVQSFMSTCRHISDITKDMNYRRRKINQLESELYMYKCHRSKDAYFKNKNDLVIVGVHESGFQDEGGPYMAQEIWANTYLRQEDGTLKMKGGSMRVGGSFEEIIEEYKKDSDWEEVKEKI